MFEVKSTVDLPPNYKLCEDQDFVYLVKDGEVAATFTSFVSAEAIADTVKELENN